MYPFASTLKLEGVRQHFRGDGQDRQRAYQYFHDERSPQIGDSLVAIYEKWGQDLTVQGQLTNCFLRFQGDNLEDESVCKLAAIALHSESIAYDRLIHALYQRLKVKENASTDSPAMYRLSPHEVEEIWTELRVSTLKPHPMVPRPPTRQLPSIHNAPYPSLDAVYGHVPASQNFGLNQGQTMTNSNNTFSGFVQQVRPLGSIPSQIYQSGLERAAQMNVEAAAIWSNLSQKVNEKWESIERNINATHNQFRNGIVEDVKSILKQEIIDTVKPLLRQEIMQECQQEIERRVDALVQNERQLKLKKETKEMLKHELKADLIDQINQAVKREMLANMQKELEASFKDKLFQTLKGTIGEDVISRLLNRNNNNEVSAPSKQVPLEEEECSSKLQEVSLQNKRAAPSADMGQHQSSKRTKVEEDGKTSQDLQHTSLACKSDNRSNKDEETWVVDRFESKNTVYETGHIKLILNTVNKTLNLRITTGNSLILIKLTHLLGDAMISHLILWLNIGTRNNVDSVWLKFSSKTDEPASNVIEHLRNAGLSKLTENPVDSVRSSYSKWAEFLSNRLIPYPGAYLQKTFPIKSLRTGTESFTGKGMKLTLNLSSRLLSIEVDKLTYKLDALIELPVTCRFSSKRVCLDLNKPVRHMIWIEIDGNSKSFVREIEGIAEIKAKEAVTTTMDEQFKTWCKENII